VTGAVLGAASVTTGTGAETGAATAGETRTRRAATGLETADASVAVSVKTHETEGVDATGLVPPARTTAVSTSALGSEMIVIARVTARRTAGVAIRTTRAVLAGNPQSSGPGPPDQEMTASAAERRAVIESATIRATAENGVAKKTTTAA